MILSPSLLSADFGNLQRDVEMLNNSQADWLHLDIMDGIFVPNISFGMPVIECVKKHSKKPLDVHLMITQPERYIKEFKRVGADILTIHIEGSTHLHRNIYAIKNEGMKAGVVLNPHTDLSTLNEIIVDVDLVLLMSVNPGYGGQSFIDGIYDKTKRLKSLIQQKNPSCLIEIDGGVNLETGKKLIQCGADALVAGSFVFSSKNPIQTIKDLKNL